MLGATPFGPDDTTHYVQYGALGILALCAIWLMTRIIPDAMRQRQKETHDMMQTLITEREKLVASMEKLVEVHSNEVKEGRNKQEQLIRDLTNRAEQERKEWAVMARESIQLNTKVEMVLSEMVVALRGRQSKAPIQNS